MRTYMKHLKIALVLFTLAIVLSAFGLPALAADSQQYANSYTITNPLETNATEAPLEKGTIPSPLSNYYFYFGNTHAHTVYSGDVASTFANKRGLGQDLSIYTAQYKNTPEFLFERAKSFGYDFFTVSDHSNVGAIIDPVTGQRGPGQTWFYENGFTEEHWQDSRIQAEKYTENGKFIPIVAYEFSRNKSPESGHMNVLNTQSWETAFPNTHTYGYLFNNVLPEEKKHAEENGSRIALTMNHASLTQYDNYFKLIDPREGYNNYVRLFEVWNSGNNKNEAYEHALALGWKVGAVNATDTHGVSAVGNLLDHMTGVLANKLTLDEIMNAMYERRVFATSIPRLQLDMTINDDILMGSAVKRPDGNLKISVYAQDLNNTVISRVDIIGGRYSYGVGTVDQKTVATMTFGKGTTLVTAENVDNTYDYYFAKVYKEGSTAIAACSSPIWMDSETAERYQATVKSIGTGATINTKYVEGAFVRISAGAAPMGKRFIKWVADSEDVVFDNENSPNTSFRMPVRPVTVTAVFEDKLTDFGTPTADFEADTVLIETVADLAKLASFVNDPEYNAKYSAKSYKLMNDLDLSAYDWLPIGAASSNPFRGIFDGNNKTIRGLDPRNNPDVAKGLFGYIIGSDENTGIIKDLNVDCNINLSSGNVGGIAGVLESGTIVNCSVSGRIEVQGSETANNVGGIVGNLGNGKSDNKLIIENCNSSTNITSSGNFVGGIVGLADASSTQGLSAIIRKCYSTGKIGSSKVVSNSPGVGGIAGNFSAKNGLIEFCYSTGDIEYKLTSQIQAGGIVGVMNGDGNTINACYSTGNIIGKGHRSGGIIGDLRVGKHTVSNCYSTGNIGSIEKPCGNSAGGIIGILNGNTLMQTIINCYSTGTIYSSGTSLGGIIGDMSSTPAKLSDNVALNKSITNGKTSINRIWGAGTTAPDFPRNYAFDFMTINGKVITDPSVIGLDKSSGANITREQLLIDFPVEAFKSEPWQYVPGGLPILTGMPGNPEQNSMLPAYIDANPYVDVNPSSLDFKNEDSDYSSVEPRFITLTNISTTDIDDLTAVFEHNDFFEIVDALSNNSMPMNESVSISIKPKDGLAIGIYNDELIIKNQHNLNIRIPISFTVQATVSFSVDGKIVGSQAVSPGSIASLPDYPVKDGYLFDGWRIGGPDGDRFNFNTEIMSDTTLYAAWVEEIVISGVTTGNGQAHVNFAIKSANGKGYSVYLSETGSEDSYNLYDDVNYNSEGVHIKGLTNGKLVYVYILYKDDSGNISRSKPVILMPNK